MPRSISTAIRRRPSCRYRAPWMSRSSSARCRRPIPCRAGASAFAVGNERLVAALARVKSYLDYGAFTPIQVAASAALNGPQECIEEMRQIYKSRRDCLVESLSRAGWNLPSPPGTMFAWAPLPAEPCEELGSLEFSKLLLEKAGVAVSPGIGFGEYGEGHVRLALVENEHRIRQAARNIKTFPILCRCHAPQRDSLCTRPGPLTGLTRRSTMKAHEPLRSRYCRIGNGRFRSLGSAWRTWRSDSGNVRQADCRSPRVAPNRARNPAQR